MQTQAEQEDSESRDLETDDELADVLTAISLVSKRLARKLTRLSQQKRTEGDKADEQDA